MLIGKKGATLEALQFLISLIVSKNFNDGNERHVILDVDGYRERREETLKHMARQAAQQAKKTRRAVILEPMNPYDRRIIHTAVQQVAGAVSWSEGEDLNRHVVIGLESKAMKRNFSKKMPRHQDNHDDNKEIKVQRDHSHESEKAPLYGKIDIKS